MELMPDLLTNREASKILILILLLSVKRLLGKKTLPKVTLPLPTHQQQYVFTHRGKIRDKSFFLNSFLGILSIKSFLNIVTSYK